LILALHERPDGVAARPGIRVVYDLARNDAHFGEAAAEGPALLWELSANGGDDATLAAEIELDPARAWLVRCDRIDFPPGGIACRHTHPGAGIRRLLFGSIRIEGPDAHVAEYGPGGAWFEGSGYPVLATASTTEPTAFVRVMVLPREWEGKRTIRYVDPADEEKPKLQRPTFFFDRPIDI
jgi:hypothetical protein